MLECIWRPPGNGEWVLNVNAALGSGRRAAGCGGVLRNGAGDWIGGFPCVYPARLSEECEAWALLKGMEWVWQRGIQPILIRSDADSVVRWINGEDPPDGPICLIILICRQWLAESWNVTVEYVNR